MRVLSYVLWVIVVLLFGWVVLQFMAPANAAAEEILAFINHILADIQQFGLRLLRLFWIR
jgi:hypothetical protein